MRTPYKGGRQQIATSLRPSHVQALTELASQHELSLGAYCGMLLGTIADRFVAYRKQAELLIGNKVDVPPDLDYAIEKLRWAFREMDVMAWLLGRGASLDEELLTRIKQLEGLKAAREAGK